MHFDDEPSAIVAYAWSRDGKKIAITRARFYDSDVVLFTELRKPQRSLSPKNQFCSGSPDTLIYQTRAGELPPLLRGTLYLNLSDNAVISTFTRSSLMS